MNDSIQTLYSDFQHYKIQHNGTKSGDDRHNDTQKTDIKPNGIQHNANRHSDTQHQ